MFNNVPITLKGDELNDRFGGGIPKNSFILIEAEDGLGKSVLAQRIAYGLLKTGNLTVTYISSELNTAGFLKQMASFNYKVHNRLMENKLMFLSLYPALGNVKFEKNFFIKLLEKPEIFDKDVIIFDSLSYLLLENELSDEVTFSIIKFLKELSALNKIMVFCVNPKNLNVKFLDLLRSISDIYLRLELKDQYGVIIKQIHIERFTGAGGELETPIVFRVLAGLGLALELAN